MACSVRESITRQVEIALIVRFDVLETPLHITELCFGEALA